MNQKPTILHLALSLVWTCLWAQAATVDTPTTAPSAPTGRPQIKFDQTTFDFGKTSQVETVSGTFKFRNVGEGTLKLSKPTTSCGCTVAGVKPEVLQPGEEGELSFTLHLGRTRAVLQKQITVDSNDPDNRNLVLTVKADYTPLYEVNPGSFYVHIRQGEATNLTARVVRTDGKPFKILKVTTSQPWIETRFESESGSTNSAARIVANLKASGSPRYFNESLHAFVEGSDQPAFNLAISGRLSGDLVVAPESLYWPVSDPEKVITTRHVMVRSSRPEKLVVSNITSSLKDVTVESLPKEDGKTLELVVKLVNIPSQTVTGLIRFDTNVPGQPKVELPLSISLSKQ